MENPQMTTKRALLVVGSLLVLSLFVPAKWFGVSTVTEKRQGLILRDPNELSRL